MSMWVKEKKLQSYMEQLTSFKLGKNYKMVVYCHPAYLTYMWNVRLVESKAEIRIARRNVNNLKWADDTTLMPESEEELKSLLMRVKEEGKKLA